MVVPLLGYVLKGRKINRILKVQTVPYYIFSTVLGEMFNNKVTRSLF